MAEDALAALQKHFEQQFGATTDVLGPLPSRKTERVEGDEENADGVEEVPSSPSSVSSHTSPPSSPGILRVSAVEQERTTIVQPGKKSFLKKMPKLLVEEELVSERKRKLSAAAEGSAQEVEQDSLEAENLKNDVALQKLLRESHLLHEAASRSGTVSLEAQGKARHKATMQHIAMLGGQTKDQKMPMAARKGMHAKRQRIKKLVAAEARESGTVLAREKKSKPSKRLQGFQPKSFTPGKMRGGTLRIPKHMLPKD
ncbi:rRNA processing protein Faf1 [Schizosaccharomyces japonicus yFS275]|uniref:rRNA processing protein Faf1 n=1 Tax=Schizosaccharomyces japonicus (strain yFS275 / FY16936) TaxID=402676 RepID=B6K0F3_SCHJY|nr:rRNA processing protein Faf1 [Schizosaccharomyces japonicus yFS275]EEB06303.1 rRNA processing protein Faf1 [Schizosaccharomyces japonicus yFS275]